MYINNLDYNEMEKLVVDSGFPRFRADQLFRWIHGKMVSDFKEMKNLPKTFIEYMNDNHRFDKPGIHKRLDSSQDNTKKYLIELEDGNIIESVYLNYDFGESVCISSQVGCNMGCLFCASTKDGRIRNLRASEMLEQIYIIQKDIMTKINSVVIMGSGEPFDNLDNVKRFIEIVTDEKGMNISKRKITLSTCGIIPGIYEALDEGMQFNLAVSLHSAVQKKRDEIIPASKNYPLKDLIKACDYYTEKTGRRVTYEYIIIKGFNDGKEDLKELVKLLKNSNCHVNLIPLNPIEEFHGEAPTHRETVLINKYLNSNGINATIRRELGRDINAACGQLRRNYINNRE
ncbi:23S rRNA (adenine2503-C2)-methyltransferase [Dethiosulfatibacter aminovorans DSM 17477]|uniref:Probable dual-specificity RNA methyltransferase RlmN n=1 Tax=Dethiosulfatibacter aminovorans DSM 17477 TaxID=1121476 RepID=A0A1M6DIX8_9FIRM|nr:23S rRNA (adenine(2503)-C(2))-methyltransferase RlmN [Dethiosulfatibacter aminovorans]SHI73009.1 23S rRNA (adenine2503-C2)-methyltransferase [Dethiosulfatibacter aminovorans DSM 17477]